MGLLGLGAGEPVDRAGGGGVVGARRMREGGMFQGGKTGPGFSLSPRRGRRRDRGRGAAGAMADGDVGAVPRLGRGRHLVEQ